MTATRIALEPIGRVVRGPESAPRSESSAPTDTRSHDTTLEPQGTPPNESPNESPHEPPNEPSSTSVSRIVLDATLFEPEATLGLKAFSHLEVIYFCDRSTRTRYGAAHPRSNPAWPRVGVLADRTQHRPNHLGLSRCRLLAVHGLELVVRGLDALDGTPVLDVKPYVRELEDADPVREPAWVRDLARTYDRDLGRWHPHARRAR